MSPRIGFCKALAEHPPLPAGLVFAWLESSESARLTSVEKAPDWIDVNTWPSGRLFGEPGEYRWRRNATGSVHAVLLLDAEELPVAFNPELTLKPQGDSDLILWGEWIDPARDPKGNPDSGSHFYAPEIPGIQVYPLSPEEARIPEATPRLRIRCYRNAEHGEFLRCLGFAMKREGP